MPALSPIEDPNAKAPVETIFEIITDEKPLEKFKLFASALYKILEAFY